MASPFRSMATPRSAMVFKGGGNVATRQGVRPFPRGRRLACPLSRLLRRTLPAGDVEAARAAVLARPGRPASMAAVMQIELAPDALQLRRDLGQLAAPAGQQGARSGRRRSTASPPKASAPSRRSTRRSPGSSRSWRSNAHAGAARPGSVVASALLILAPPGARAADLVVWWEKGYYAQEDAAVREIIAAFEQKTGKQVELVLPLQRTSGQDRGRGRGRTAARFPVRLQHGLLLQPMGLRGPADRPLGRHRAASPACSIRTRSATPPARRKTADGPLRGYRWAVLDPQVHVWKSLLEQRGVHARRRPQRMGGVLVVLVRPGAAGGAQGYAAATTSRASAWRCRPASADTDGIQQFRAAYEADYVTRDGRLVIDDPEIRHRLIKAIDTYTSIYRKGCTPPDRWHGKTIDNNEEFLAQAVVMTPNETLSINALKDDRPEDYYQNAATIEWPVGPTESPFRSIAASVAVVFKGAHVPRPRSSCASSSAKAGSPIISTSPASVFCRRSEAARPAVLARPPRPAPDGRGHADPDPANASEL